MGRDQLRIAWRTEAAPLTAQNQGMGRMSLMNPQSDILRSISCSMTRSATQNVRLGVWIVNINEFAHALGVGER